LEHYRAIAAGLTNVDFVVDDGPLSWLHGDNTEGATLLGGSVFDLLGIGTAIHLFPDFFERGYAEAVLTIVHEAAHRFAAVGHGESVNSAENLAQYAGSVHRAHDRRRMRELAQACAEQLWEAYVGGAALYAPFTTEDGVEIDGVLCGGARLEWFEAHEKAHHDELFQAFEQGHTGDEPFTCVDGTVLRSDLVGAMWQRWSS
jgi:hypothetical protein